MVNLRKPLTIAFSAVSLTCVTTAVVFLVFNSRLTADEYLAAPILHGFYVDAPARTLFEVSNNLFMNYLQGVKAIAFLGWDPFGNAATFQMIPAVLANYFGPLASTFLAIVVHAVIILVSLAFSIQLLISKADRIIFTSIFILCLFIAVIAGNYQTSEPFGIFPLTGIRFSSYLIQPLLLLLLIYFFIKSIVVGSLERRKLSLIFIAFPMFVSLWTTMYLLLLVPIVFIVIQLTTNNKIAEISYWLKPYSVVLGIAALNASFVLFPKVDAGRSVTERADSADKLTDYAATYLMSEKAGAYFLGVLQTIFSDHSAIGLLSGLALALFLGERLVLTKTSLVFVTSLTIFTITLPFVFTFQELITYPAFWHKTSPIVYSFVLWFFLGLLAGKKLRIRLNTPKALVGLVSLSLVGAVAFVETTQLRDRLTSAGESLVVFRENWDDGDPFGLNTSVENVANSTILNFMQLYPYRHPLWVPPDQILEDVKIVFETSRLQEAGFAGGTLEFRAISTYFSEELGERVYVEFEVVDTRMSELGKRTITKFTAQESDIDLRAVTTSRGLLVGGEVPLNKTIVLNFDGICEMGTGEIELRCYKVLNSQLGFSEEFKRNWSSDR